VFKKLIAQYRKLSGLPKQVNELQAQLSEQKKLNYSNVETNQRLLFEHYKSDATNDLSGKGFRVHSQFEEDGLLLYIFSKIGFKTRTGIEMCCGWGSECMLANLILYHGFDALLFDGDAYSVSRAKQFFGSHPNSFLHPPTIVQQWITKENINDVIIQNGYKGEIDIFSLDVDGIDYYLMQALTTVSPRVIICETHNVIPADLALTIPYSADFNCADGKYDPEFRSASLFAMVKLMQTKGYRLVGTNRYGFNAIFLRNDIGSSIFPEVNHADCLKDSYTAARVKVWDRVSHLPWVEV